MQRYIRNTVTGELLGKEGWTQDPWDAIEFRTLPDAVNESVFRKLADVEIVIRFSGGSPELTLPLQGTGSTSAAVHSGTGTRVPASVSHPVKAGLSAR